MTSQENPPLDPNLKHNEFMGEKNISLEEAIAIQDKNKKLEYIAENELSAQRVSEDKKSIEEITKEAAEAAKLTQNIEHYPTQEVVDVPSYLEETSDDSQEEYKKTKHVSGFKKVALAATMFFAGLSGAKAADSEKNPSDSIKNKTEKIFTDSTEKKVIEQKIEFKEADQEVAGLHFKGTLSVPMVDSTYEYYFVGFEGNKGDNNKIDRMKNAATELGFQLATKEDLRQVVKYNGNKLVKKVQYGMAIGGEAGSEVDDASSVNVNTGVGPQVGNFATVNPLGEINRFEHNQLSTLDYADYGILVKKQKVKEISPDFTKKSNTVPLPGSDVATK